MPSKSLDDLDSRFRPFAEQLIKGCLSRGIDVTVIDTLRTLTEQDRALHNGTSWTQHSKHLAQPPENKSLAIDIAPTSLLHTKNWDPSNALWWQLGELGKSLGLRWGGDWHDQGMPPVGEVRSSWDPGHFEFIIH